MIYYWKGDLWEDNLFLQAINLSRRKMLSRISSVLTLLLATVPLMLTTQANPVPFPLISMPYEYVYANVTVSTNAAYARINGTYPFVNWGYENVSMSYPLPQDSSNVSVEADGNMSFWRYSDANYSTVFGDLPVISWTIDPAPNEFAVEVDYGHAVPVVARNFTYFYAMGTWKHLTGYYVKQTTAYVTADISVESIGENETLDVHAYQIILNSTTQERIWLPQNCTVSRSDNMFQVGVTVVSDLFSPIKGDFLLTFKKATTSGFLSTDLNEYGIELA
jgi:hypothetical protein